MRRVVARASSRPPPRAMEAMAVMVGMRRLDKAMRVLRSSLRKSLVLKRDFC